ncbi:MAG: YciC family protein [Dehalococcoidales bacterium]
MEQPSNANASPVMLQPGVGSAYGNGWNQLWKHFLDLLVIMIITWAISFAFSLPETIAQWRGNTMPLYWNLVSLAFTVLVLWPLNMGMNFAYLKAARGQKVDIGDMFEGFRNYWNVIAATFLLGLLIGIGLILLIVPGIIIACKLAFVPYLVVDRKMGAAAAIDASWKMTGGHAGTVFLIGLLAIPIVIAGLICLGVGVIPATMWVSLALASLYHAVSTSGPQLMATPPSTAPPVA